MRQKKGFTLIELLVVIAIIALLLAILMPSLKTAKKIAQSIVCSSNLKTLSMAAVLFAQDNDDMIPQSYPTTLKTKTSENGWVNIAKTPLEFEDRVHAIEMGSLYPYVEDHKPYHCPGDKRFSSQYHNYLSYSMPSCIRPDKKGEPDSNKYITTFSQISHPSEKYIFLEESDPRDRFRGPWSFGVKEHSRDGWWDGLAIWHNNSSTFGFADGHAEGHKWRDEYTKVRAGWSLAELEARGGSYGYLAWPNGAYGGVRNDLDWMQAHWPMAR